MQITSPALVLAAQAGATQFQEYDEGDKNVNRGESNQRSQKRFISGSRADGIDNYQGVIGRPGIDFPVLTDIPSTKFNCQQYGNGYFADLDTKCQVFHICDEGKKISFLCPNGTIFRQLDLICDWWFKVDCAAAPNHYAESSEMLTQAHRARKQSEHPIQQPIESAEQFSLKTKQKHALLNRPLGPNMEALALNRRMDTSFEECDESVFEDILLKQKNIRRSNKASKLVNYNSEETQTTDETASFIGSRKTLNGYSYLAPEKSFIVSNSKSDIYSYDKPVKHAVKNNKNVMHSIRAAKIWENNAVKMSRSKNSFHSDAQTFIPKQPVITTPIPPFKQQMLRATTFSSVNRGSTTHQTSNLNGMADSMFFNPINMQSSLNISAYTTARKPSTKLKDKTFYSPTIPTVTKRTKPEIPQDIPTLATSHGPSKHAIEMIKTLQNLEKSQALVLSRPGIEVPPSSAPDALHSLALYFADGLGLNATTTVNPIERTVSIENWPVEEKLPSSTSLLSQTTIDRYHELFNVKSSNTTTESLKFEAQFSDDTDNDLEGQYSRHPVFDVPGSLQIRELAQVFTHALSAYLQDPDTFRRILSEIRPKAPQHLIASNHVDRLENTKNEDISTEETSYFLPFNQITPAPRAPLMEESEVLDFSDATLPTTFHRDTTIINSETTTGISCTTAIYPMKESAKINTGLIKTTASNLVTQYLERTAAAYRESQFIGHNKEKKSKHELADEVNEELGTLKPPAFGTVETLEDMQARMDSSKYIPLHGKKKTPIHWSAELLTTTDSANTVYFDLLPPPPPRYDQKSSLQKEVLMAPNQGEILEEDEQLQRAQSQSIYASQNALARKIKIKSMHNFSNTDKPLQQSKKVGANIPIKMTTPTTVEDHYITTQLKSQNLHTAENSKESSIYIDNAPPRLPDTGEITPNTKTTLSYTVFLDPLTINDGLMNEEKDESLDKTNIVNPYTYLPSSKTKTTYTFVESTTIPATMQWYSTHSTESSRIKTSRRAKSKNSKKIREDESNETEFMETMQKKANQIFGDLDESEADHLMKVMKTADKNKSVRRLILLLIQTCDDDYNKTAEDSRKALLSALISMDRQEFDGSRIHVVKSRFNKGEKVLNKPSTTVATPITSYKNVQFEKLTDTTTDLDLEISPESSETTTTNNNEMKTTSLDLLIEASTTIFPDKHANDDIETTTMPINLFPNHYTSTNIPTTTIDIDIATNDLTTTELPTTSVISTAFNSSLASFIPMKNKQASYMLAENIQEQNTQTSEKYFANYVMHNSNHHSDARALELLRSLYSLASRWG